MIVIKKKKNSHQSTIKKWFHLFVILLCYFDLQLLEVLAELIVAYVFIASAFFLCIIIDCS